MADLKKLYDDVIMDHIKNARNYHKLEGANREAQGSNPLCGDVLTVYLRLRGEIIEDIGLFLLRHFDGFGFDHERKRERKE